MKHAWKEFVSNVLTSNFWIVTSSISRIVLCMSCDTQRLHNISHKILKLPINSDWPCVWKTWKCYGIGQLSRNWPKVSVKEKLWGQGLFIANFTFGAYRVVDLSICEPCVTCFKDFAAYEVTVNIFAAYVLIFTGNGGINNKICISGWCNISRSAVNSQGNVKELHNPYRDWPPCQWLYWVSHHDSSMAMLLFSANLSGSVLVTK